LSQKCPSETLLMLEEVYCKVTMKKTQVYRWHKCDDLCCRRPQIGDAQSLSHYEFIPEGLSVNEEIYVKILRHLRDAVRRKRPKE
jgi:hypothetical protein